MNISIRPRLQSITLGITIALLSACAGIDGKSSEEDFIQFEQPASIAQPVAVEAAPKLEPEVAQALEPVVQPPVVAHTQITETPMPNPYLSKGAAVDGQTQAQFKQALKAFKAKQYKTARRLFIALSQAKPELSGAYLNLALIAQKQKQGPEAEAYFKQALAANEQNIYAYSEYALWLRQQGQFEQAKLQLQQALDVWPDYPQGHRNLGILLDLYLAQGRDALAHYKKYQSLLPKPDRLVRAWIIDLERRLKAQAAKSAATQ